MERKSGFYWVKLNPEVFWDIAYYHGDGSRKWERFKTYSPAGKFNEIFKPRYFTDNDFMEIDNQRIERIEN